MNILKLVILAATVLFLSNCASTNNTELDYIDLYDREFYTPEQIATLFVPNSIYISELDGERLPSGYAYNGAAIRTLPGQHQAKFNYGNPGELTQQGSLKFDLEQNKSYFLSMRNIGTGEDAVIRFDVYECGGEEEKATIRDRRKQGWSAIAPCAKD